MGELWAEGEGQEMENSPCKVLQEDALPKREEPAFLPERNLFSKVLFLAISSLSCRGSSQPRDRTQVYCIAGRFFTS